MSNKVAVLIIFFNKLSQTILCVESFLKAEQNIYILNNGSDEESWKIIKNNYSHNSLVFLFSSDVNLGPAGGRNFLIEKCFEEWIFIVDNDVCITPDKEWKKCLDEKINNQLDGLIFSPKIFNVHDNSYSIPQNFIHIDDLVYLTETDKAVTNYFSCCGIIINRKIFEMYGYFDHNLYAFEDYEFSIRALLSPLGELKVYQISEIELLHDHQVQNSKNDRSAVLERYNEGKIMHSMQHLTNKHSIQFDHNWQWWTRKQVALMTKRSIFRRLENLFKRLLFRK